MAIIGGTNLGQPDPGSTVTASRLLGVSTINDFLYAFVSIKDSAGKVTVWTKWWYNGWQNWTNLTTSANAPADLSFDDTYQGCVATVGSMIYVFMRGKTDQKLWCLFWNGMWQWVCLSTATSPAVSKVDVALSSPLNVNVVTTTGAYYAVTYNGAMWVWQPAPAGCAFVGKTTEELFTRFKDRWARFQINTGTNYTLQYSAAGVNPVSTKKNVMIKCVGNMTGMPNPRFSIRGINPTGEQVETPFFERFASQPATGNANNNPDLLYGQDLTKMTQFKAGADCWIACDPATPMRQHNESANNFNYDPNASDENVYYTVNGALLAPFVVYSRPDKVAWPMVPDQPN